MIKKLSILALAGLIAMPAIASAATNADLEDRIAELEEQSEGWDLASRIQLSGDTRSRFDWMQQDRMVADGFNYVGPVGGDLTDPANYFPADTKEVTDKNTSLWTTRFRVNMRAKATENVEVKARLAMYKAWGMQDTPASTTVWGGFPAFDGTSSRQVADNSLLVDRVFMNWNNIAGQPIWFSIGRRPTTDGAPSHLRMNSDKRMATPTAFMDWPFDGISMGYAYWSLFGIDDAPGRIRVCYGRGFENGVAETGSGATIQDTDFIGLSWDILSKGSRLVYLQSFAAMDVFNYPDFNGDLVDMAFGGSDLLGLDGLVGDRDNIGDIYHTSAAYMDKVANFNYFASAGWSRTDPNENGMFNDVIGMMNPASGVTANTDSEDGFTVFVGGRYDLDDLGLKLGAEYNWGSQYWIGMTPGHDDMYTAKLATRGSVYEAYMIYDLPSGEATSKFASAFIRVGYQHYEFDYAGGMDWNMMPYELGVSNDMESLSAAALEAAGMMDTVTSRDQVYVTVEATF